MAGSPRQIPLVGGPLDGCVHELHGAIPPAKLGLPAKVDPRDYRGIVANPPEIHWYAISDGAGHFLHTETKVYDGDGP